MAALITTIIPAQNFETVRDQIGAILFLELTNQGILDTTFKVPKIFNERATDPDKTEMPVVNVCLYKGDYERKTLKSSHGTYIYTIDSYDNSPSSVTERGDKAASRKMQQMIGKIRTILDSWQYSTLGFAKGNVNGGSCGIEHTEVTSFKMMEKGEPEDSLFSTMGRIAFMVKVPEGVPLGTGALCNISTAVVTLEETTNGYQYQFPQTI